MLNGCHPERSVSGVEGSSHCPFAEQRIGAKILRCASLTQDDRFGGWYFCGSIPVFGEILPVGIGTGDQMILLVPPPTLELFLAGDGTAHVAGVFKVDQLMNVVFGGETVCKVVFVLVKSSLKVVGYADVED